MRTANGEKKKGWRAWSRGHRWRGRLALRQQGLQVLQHLLCRCAAINGLSQPLCHACVKGGGICTLGKKVVSGDGLFQIVENAIFKP